jgi:hypothetical protein
MILHQMHENDLDIDDDVLEAAKELARSEKRTAGQVISSLARKSLTKARQRSKTRLRDGWHALPPGAAILTSEAVERLLNDADLEEALPSPQEN